MPRDIGTGLYHYPAGTEGNTAQTIFSARYNTFINDLANTLNQALPINMGGTGATSAVQARDNLDAERSGAQVTNYDTHVWEAGSFWSDASAAGEPVAGHPYVGTCQIYGAGQDYITLQVRDVLFATEPVYVRQKQAGVWTGWVADSGGAWLAGQFVNITGDTMSGNLGVGGGVLTVGPSGGEFTLSRSGLASDMFLAWQANSYQQFIYSSGDWRIVQNGVERFKVSAIGAATITGTLEVVGTTTITGSLGVTNALTVTGDIGQGGVAAGTTPGAGSTVVGIATSGNRMFMSGTGANPVLWLNINADASLMYCQRSGVAVGSISVTTTNTAFNTASDERLKEDLKSFDAGNIVDDTNVYDFAWKATGERSYGVLAQQAWDVYPHAVTHEEKEDRWFIDYSKYVPVLLQELKALRARVAELEGKIGAGVQPA